MATRHDRARNDSSYSLRNRLSFVSFQTLMPRLPIECGSGVARSLLGIDMNLREFGIAAAVLAAIVAGDWALRAGDMALEASAHQAAERAQPAQQAPTQFTKAQFMAEVEGKTKAEVRARFGRPDNVDDASDSWYYWHLQVYDESAGTQVNNTQIRFDGINGPDDRVAQVRYP